MEEIWKSIKNYEEDYEVSNTGKVRSIDRYIKSKDNSRQFRQGIYLYIGINNNGYYFIRLFKNSKPKTINIHRLVAKTFIDNPLNLPEVNHKNGDKSNNNDWNLAWSSKLDNIQHAFNTGLMDNIIGENNHNNKLTENQVLEIRKLKDIFTQRVIAVKYNISQRLVWNILNNKTWRYI